MQTTHYTLTAQEIVMSGDGLEDAAGGGRQLVCLRPRAGGQPRERGDNVIDLAAWRAERSAEDAAQEQWEPARSEEPEEMENARPPARRPRRERRPSMAAEWLATLSVIAVMAALMVKILSF